MYRSLEQIQEDLADAFKTKNRGKCQNLNEEQQEFLNFWADVEAIAVSHGRRSTTARMNEFFETTSITDQDADFLSHYFQKLADEARRSADADEGIRMMQDFFRLQRGLPIERSIALACTGPVSPRFVYDEPVKVDDDNWLEADECPWLNAVMDTLQGHHPLQMFYSARMPWKDLSDVIQTLELVMKAPALSVSEGMYLSIMLPIEFTRMRDNWMLPKHAVGRHKTLICAASIEI